MYQNTYIGLQHLRRPPVNPGGLCWIVYARKSDVAQWPLIHPETGAAFTGIVLKDGATWYDFKPVNRDRFFTETMKVSEAGAYWEQQVNGYFGGATDGQVLGSMAMGFEEFVVMFQDRSGSIRFIGNEDAGAICAPSYNSGEGENGRKQIFTFTWMHPGTAPIYQLGDYTLESEPITPPFARNADFNDDFNNDFFN